MIAGAYNSEQEEPRYFAEADFDDDGDVDFCDVVIAVGSYGQAHALGA